MIEAAANAMLAPAGVGAERKIAARAGPMAAVSSRYIIINAQASAATIISIMINLSGVTPRNRGECITLTACRILRVKLIGQACSVRRRLRDGDMSASSSFFRGVSACEETAKSPEKESTPPKPGEERAAPRRSFVITAPVIVEIGGMKASSFIHRIARGNVRQ